MTRAPRSPSSIVQKGPARTRERSRTRIPSSGAVVDTSLTGSGGGTPGERAGQEVEEADGGDLDAFDPFGNAPVLRGSPQEVGGRIRRENAVALAIELDPLSGVHLMARRLDGAVRLRIAVEARVLSVGRDLARMVVRIRIDGRGKRRVPEQDGVVLSVGDPLRHRRPVQRPERELDADLRIGLPEDLGEHGVDREAGRVEKL